MENVDIGHWDKEKRAEFFQKRQKELHDKLALTSSQEPAWNRLVAKIKPNEMHKKEDWKEMSKLRHQKRLDRIWLMPKIENSGLKLAYKRQRVL